MLDAKLTNVPDASVEKLMDFEPINDDHAIQSVAFLCVLASPLGPGIAAIENAHKNIRRELPAQIPLQAFQFAAYGQVPFPMGAKAVQFSYLLPDATAIWTLRTAGQDVSAETTRYLGWDKSWEQARFFLDFALSEIASVEPQNFVISAALTVVDRFRALKEDYDLATLLKPNDALPVSTWKRGTFWHNHSGWFENVGNDQVLHRLNLDVRREGSDAFEESSG